MPKPTKGPGGVEDSPIAHPHNFRFTIEGQCMAMNEDECDAFVMNSVSFTAAFGQFVGQIRVASKAAPPNLGLEQ